ncbi:uncharacterized protein MELLADRAFT_110311 [Melampsora larici-populina 98AG31]|uniref:Uncharacterized protein n=1 Tax=Melampsora larici-populina (strain 98AG31 / pathotype 3-4-7) TaxID=747676 RepID=F4RZC8_MELLP|nr:uncharacterized protein MELLADRAFT_110311 [Melampsora larici-populina 98AG31]EGG02277.1 hypothetical protein MELLADRAFT_110311 [Melampsora larici-populina 98AG31]
MTAASRAIRANRRAQGIEPSTSTQINSSLDGSDMAPEEDSNIGNDSESTEILAQANANNNGQMNQTAMNRHQGNLDDDHQSNDIVDENPNEDENPSEEDNPRNNEDNEPSSESDGATARQSSNESSEVSEEDPDKPDSSNDSSQVSEDEGDSDDSSSDSEAPIPSNPSILSGSGSGGSSDGESSLSGGEEDSDSEEDGVTRRKRRRRMSVDKITKLLAQLKKEKSKAKKTTKSRKKNKKHKTGKKESRGKGKTSKKSKKKKTIEIDIGVVPSGDLVQLQPFWSDQMDELNTSIPLTVFDQNFARLDKSKVNKGLEAPSEYTQSFGEWSKNMSLFRRYLTGYYGQAPLAKRLRLHIDNVKSIKRSTECWLTALRYDILVQAQIFVKRGEKEKMKDIGTLAEKYLNQAKDKSLRAGEANCGDTNPYAKGGRLEFKHPETGTWRQTTQPTASSSNNKRVVVESDTQPFKKRRGAKRNTNTTQSSVSHHTPVAPERHFATHHGLPPNPMSYQGLRPIPPTAPMAANRFPGRGGRGGHRGNWRGGRGGIHNVGQEG